jgi:hypothetical protein
VWGSAGDRGANGHHWQKLASLMPCQSTEPSGTCRVGDGRRTAFWLDAWLCALPLCCQFPALFSHALKPEASVQVVVKPGVRLPGPETDQCWCARARPAACSDGGSAAQYRLVSYVSEVLNNCT